MDGSFLSRALTTLFILLQFTTNIDSCLASSRPTPTNTNTDYIKKSCGATLYPQLCYNSLSIYANKIQTNPKALASTALSVTLSAAKSTSSAIKSLSKMQGLKPREAAAMADCVEELGDSVDELSKSMEEMGRIGGGGGPNFELQASDIQTWVSAALTDDDTCTDGLAGKAMNGQLKIRVRTLILKVAHLTSNALALFNSYAAVRNQNLHATSP